MKSHFERSGFFVLEASPRPSPKEREKRPRLDLICDFYNTLLFALSF